MQWPTVMLGEVCVERTGTTDPTVLGNDTFRYVDISSVDARTKQIVNPKTLIGRHAPSRARRQIMSSDVIVSMTRPNLNAVAMVGPDLSEQICSTGFCVLRAGPRLDPRFLFHFVQTAQFVDALTGLTGGAMYPAVTEAQVRQQGIPLPPLHKQRRIAEILDRAAAIQRLRLAAEEKVREIMPVLFVDMFGDPATNPKGFPACRLSDAIDRIETGKNVMAGAGTSRYRILKVSAVTSGTYNEQESKPAPDAIVPDARSLVRRDDFLFSRANTAELVGATVLVRQTNGLTLLPDKLWRIVWRPGLSPDYMLGVMHNRSIRAAISREATGTSASMRNVSQGKLRGIQFPLAPPELQAAYAQRVAILSAIGKLTTDTSRVAEAIGDSLTGYIFPGV